MNPAQPSFRPTPEWREQWTLFQDSERFLFEEWIAPFTVDDFRGKTVLEAGCGGGQHTSFIAPVAKSVTGVDLNTADIARERNREFPNVTFLDGDIASMDLGEKFDVVLCIGVIHHTDDPDRTFSNLYSHLRAGGWMIVWTYSAEGNAIVRHLVEPVRKGGLRHLPRPALVWVARALTAAMYPAVNTIYRIPALGFLPYYEYFGNFRRLAYSRNVLNVFDKLNAPQTRFTTRAKCNEWFNAQSFEPGSISIRPYKGVSYSLSGIKRRE